MIHKFSRYLLTLVALLTMTTGAWATDGELLVTITPDASGNIVYSVADIATLDLGGAEYNSSKGCWRKFGGAAYLTVTAADGINVTKVKFTTNKNDSWEDTDAPYQVQLDGGYALNASGSSIGTGDGIKKIEVYGTAEPPIEVTPVAGKTNEWTFSMPGSDVELTPIYAPAAAFNLSDGSNDKLPAPVEGIFIGSTNAIITEGVCAQGSLMYAVSTSATEAPSEFSSVVPTAENILTPGTYYVWYFIAGADTPQGETPTAENTFNDSEICTEPIEVNISSDKFDIQFNAANANTIEAGKATVTVDGQSATLTDGKLTGVKMDSKVTITAATGYKFRKVEVKKASKLLSITISGVTVYYAEGDSWADAIKRDENKNSGLFIREGNRVHHPDYGQLVDSNTQPVLPDAKINANESYRFIK